MMMYTGVQLTVILTSVLLMLFQGTISFNEEVKPFQFIRVIPTTIEEVVILNNLEEVYEEENKAVFLRSAGPPGTPTDIVVEGYSFEIFTEHLESAGIPYIVENVEEKLAEKLRKPRDVSDAEYDHTRYHTYDEITAWLKTLVQRHNNIASLFTIGKTFEGRDMYVIKITSDTGGNKKPGIWIEGGIHAREKIAPATVVFIIQQILEQYGNDNIVTELVDETVWYLLPVMNVDGYEYAMIPMENVTSVREYFNSLGVPNREGWEKLFWRRTRSVHNNTSCIGVDPNRNWDFKWKVSLHILEQYGNDKIVTELVDEIVWYLLPVMNIDGYEYAMIPMENVTSVREYFNSLGVPNREGLEKLFWRRTRSVHNNTSCIGVDPNRNWDFKWKASSPTFFADNETKCSPINPGPKPFSEVEVRNVANFLLEHPYIDAYVSMHSYGQIFLFPWCWTLDKPEHYDELSKLAEKASNAIRNVYGTNYTYGSVSETIGGNKFVMHGCSCDWTYEVAGITYSYGLELRDNGVYRFFLPEDQIEPTGIETFEGIKEIAKHLISLDRNAATCSLPSLPIWMLTRLCFMAFCAVVCCRA
ncbi:carboxypeptidase A2-like [Anneissia japonica]|uniref:carboxypeptidase A2-like n=1 Tax=Anneissia japonica TaxID=1529436 RepID=UPI0014259AD1|nr:carboxypeptidase A2-like [Anneissia japonica]